MTDCLLLVMWLCLCWPMGDTASQKASTVTPKVVAPTATAPAKAAAVPESTPDVDWPQFRGPDGQGHGVGHNLPIKWSEITNIAWKTDLPGEGWSSPVIHNGKIWMTTAINDSSTLKVLCVDQATGKLEQDIVVFQVPTPGKIHSKNGHASPTPLIDNGRIFVHFGAHGTACLDETGKILWKTKLNYYHHHGPASSPIVVGQKLIIPCDGFERSYYDKEVKSDVTDFQYLAALNVETGDVIWKRPHKGRHSYATPLLIEVDGKPQIISPGGDRVGAYDPETGDEIWGVRYTGYSLIPRPVFGHGLVFVCTGYDNAQLLAIRPDGNGDVTGSHVSWNFKQGVSFTPSPILVGDELYFVSDGGIATCVEAETGKMLWKRRLGGNFSASPVFADDKIYFIAEEGSAHVLAPGKQYKRLSINKLNGTTFASPAISGNAIYLRSDKSLYRIEEGAKSSPKPVAISKTAMK